MEPPEDTRLEKPNGEEIRRLRKSQGMTAADLAKKAKVSLKSIGNAEAGRNVFVKTMSMIATALGVGQNAITLSGDNKKSGFVIGDVELRGLAPRPWPVLDEIRVMEFIELLQSVANSKDIDAERVDPANHVLTISLPITDLMKLISCMSMRWHRVEGQPVETAVAASSHDSTMGYPYFEGWRANMQFPATFFLVSTITIPQQDEAPQKVNGKTFRDNMWNYERRRGLRGLFIRFLDLFRR